MIIDKTTKKTKGHGFVSANIFVNECFNNNLLAVNLLDLAGASIILFQLAYTSLYIGNTCTKCLTIPFWYT